MRKLNKTIERIENDIEVVFSKAKGPLQTVVNFAKEHKKLLIIVGVVLLAYKYFFSEEEEDY